MKIITSEAVTPGHPDKICDQIADAILDAAIKERANCHNAVEVTIKGDNVLIYGETDTNLGAEKYEGIAREVLDSIGYDSKEYNVTQWITEQSPEINEAVKDENAGDQGIMFGYATNENSAYLPMSYFLAEKLAKRLFELSKTDERIKPDGKTQVSVLYDTETGTPIGVTNVLVSTSHAEGVTLEELTELIKTEVVDKEIPGKLMGDSTTVLINPAGLWTEYGPKADSGTTGRKIVCDTYGGVGRVGGGCLSSKDPSKVDRSAAYYCRYVAKNLVKAGLCERCEVGVSYAIGKADPLSIEVNSFGTGNDDELVEIIKNNFNFKVSNIIEELKLRRPIYRKTANFGQFADDNYSWEKEKQLDI